MDNVIDLAARRKAKQEAQTQQELNFNTVHDAANDEKPVQKTKEQIAEERRQHNAQVLKNYRIK